jgi:hypothetical protein
MREPGKLRYLMRRYTNMYSEVFQVSRREFGDVSAGRHDTDLTDRTAKDRPMTAGAQLSDHSHVIGGFKH